MIFMKGIELPISTIIVIILVLVVLIAVLGLFYGVWPSGAQTATLESVKGSACQLLMSSGGCGPDPTGDLNTKHIPINNFDADKNGKTNDPGSNIDVEPRCHSPDPNTNDNLFMLCRCWYNLGGNDDQINSDCKTKVCNCPANS